MSGARNRFDIGALMKARKEAKGQHAVIEAKIVETKRDLKTKRIKLQRLDSKVSFQVLEKSFEQLLI